MLNDLITSSSANNSVPGGSALEQTEIPPELFLPFRGLSSVPLFFSDYCRKLTTHRGVTITRVVVCTCEHFYLCHPNGDILRCFPYTAVSKIFHDEVRHQVGIVVPCEFDLALETPLSFQLIHVIDVLRRLHGARTQLELHRVGSVPRPEGFLGLRPDGSTIWDPHVAKHRKIKSDQSCTDQVLGVCGLQDAWIACKDSCYRYYRRVMRSLDLGIEDDDEVLTNTTVMSTAMMANNANENTANGASGAAGTDGKDGKSSLGNQFTVMLAAGKTSFAFSMGAKPSASKANLTSAELEANNKNGNNSTAAASGTATEDSLGLPSDALTSGYRWFRPTEEDLKKKKIAEERSSGAAAKRKGNRGVSGSYTGAGGGNPDHHFSDNPEDNEVLNLLLSPMLNGEDGGDELSNMMNSNNGTSPPENGAKDNDDDDDGALMIGRLSPRQMDDDNNNNNSSSLSSASSPRRRVKSEQEERNRNQWWPGCQVGWPDGPYTLALAKPKGFKVALDQRNSEFV